MFRLSSFKYTSRKYRSTLQICIKREYTDTEMISYDSKRKMKIENCFATQMYMQILRLAVHGHVPTRTANNYRMRHC